MINFFKKKNRHRYDIFRPTYDPIALEIYDALQKEAEKREAFNSAEWIENERNVVWETARKIAEREGLRVPTLDLIKRKEDFAVGQADYGRVWTVGISDWMQEN